MPRLFRLFVYSSPPREPLADTFARVLATVGRPGDGIARLLFYFENNPSSNLSGVERIARGLPPAAPFLYGAPDEPRVLSNFSSPWIGAHPNPPAHPPGLDPAALEEILRGIPRRFPVWKAGVTFDGVDWPGTGEGLAAGLVRGVRDPVAPSDWRYLFPSVSIQRWHGRASCHAMVEWPDPAAEPDAATAAKLRRIRRIQRQDVRAGFTPGELVDHLARKTEADTVLAGFEAQADTWLADRVRLPFEFPPERDRPLADVRFSLKDAVLREFGPRGYRHMPNLGDQSGFVLLRATPGHHVLHLYADRGTWSRSISCQFRFVGLEKVHAFNLPAGPGRRFQYRAGDQAQVDRVVANWAAVVDALERDLVPRLETIYGSDPPWFPTLSMGRPGGSRGPRNVTR